MLAAALSFYDVGDVNVIFKLKSTDILAMISTDYSLIDIFVYIPALERIILNFISTYYVKKGKAVPLQARSGPEGSRKLRFPDLVTTAQDSGKVVSLTHRPSLPPGNTPGTNFC